MNRSIEQALLSLLPTHNSTLPKPLTDLAGSLLAQSRHRASTLKAEEEVARPYACAHIACDRLKITLNLPPIDPRPPIPPRIYKRLYNHLEKILPSAASTPSRATPGVGVGSGRLIKTPTSRRAALNAASPTPARGQVGKLPATPSRGTPSRATPSKDKSLAQFRGTVSAATPKKSNDGLPLWMRPTCRYLCNELENPRIGPVVMAGVESIVAPRGQRTDDKWVNANLSSLLGALYLYVWRGVTWPGRDLDEAIYIKTRKQLAAAINRAREAVTVRVSSSSSLSYEQLQDAAWQGWHQIRLDDLDTATLRIHRHGWLELDWKQGIDDIVRADNPDKYVETQEASGGGQGDDSPNAPEPLPVRRADTMFQERYDYLSEKRRAEYAEWKEGILNRIKELERAPGDQSQQHDPDAMDVDGA